MKKAIWILAMLIIAASALAADEIAYSVLVHYDSGKFNLEKVTLIESNPMPVSKGNDYVVQVVSFSGIKLYETSFNVQLRAYDIDLELKETIIDLVLPWHPNAKDILIKKNETIMLKIDVSQHALCNENAQCDEKETFKSCPQECEQENLTMGATSAQPEEFQNKANEEPIKNLKLYIIATITILLFAVILLFLKKKRTGK